MGNAASGLPFKLADKIEYESPQRVCELLRGSRTDSKDDQTVSVFRYSKPSPRIPMAQRHWQKLRTLKHPYVISYMDGVELEDSVLVVTEDVTPLSIYVKSRSGSSTEMGITAEELTWGFKCISQAVSFLHSNCNLVHGFLGMHAIFVSKSGDWKVGCFDLTCNTALPEDEAFFASNESMLPDAYRSPERANSKGLPNLYPLDVFSLGVIITETFKAAKIELPSDMDQLVRRMLNNDPRRRPSLALVLKSPSFQGEKMALLSTLDELLLKSTADATEALANFSSNESIAPISTELCSFKLLPCVGRILTAALEEFQLRDSRESARKSITACLGLLSLLGTNNKLAESHLSRTCTPHLVSLWTLSDRAVRTALLKSLPCIVHATPANIINSKIFDALLNGFADNNLKMREDTLKSLVCLLDKLDEKQLQDKLVRCMMGLQNDAEPAIRTNATIFIGRIAPRLSSSVKAKVLCTSYAKALKDPFIHCRVAGLKAALSTMSLLVEADYLQLVSKLLPQICTQLVDKSDEVRKLSLQFVDECCVYVRDKHKEQSKIEEAAAAKAARLATKTPKTEVTSGTDRSGVAGVVSEGAKDDSWSSGWTSWAVESISKSLEQVTASPAVETQYSAEIVIKNKPAAAPVRVAQKEEEGWGDDNDDWGADADEPEPPLATKPQAAKVTGTSKSVPAAVAKDTNGWAEDDDDWVEEEEEEVPKKVEKPVVKKPLPSTKSAVAAVPAKPVNSWGDDDDLDDDLEDEPKKVEKKPVTVVKPVIAKSTPAASSWGDDDDLDDDDDEPPKLPAAKKPVVVSNPAVIVNKPVKTSTAPEEDEDWDLDDDVPTKPVAKPVVATKAKASAVGAVKPSSSDDWPDDVEAEFPKPKTVVSSKTVSKVSMEKETVKKSLKSGDDSKEVKKVVKKVAVKKLSVDKDESWDDF